MAGHRDRTANRDRYFQALYNAAATPVDRAVAAFNWWRAAAQTATPHNVQRAADRVAALLMIQRAELTATDTAPEDGDPDDTDPSHEREADR